MFKDLLPGVQILQGSNIRFKSVFPGSKECPWNNVILVPFKIQYILIHIPKKMFGEDFDYVDPGGNS